MIRYFAGHPTAANLLMVAFVVIGLVSVPTLQREPVPARAGLTDGLRPRPEGDHVVEAPSHGRDPAGPELDHATLKLREALEHTVEDQGRQEAFAVVVEDGWGLVMPV